MHAVCWLYGSKGDTAIVRKALLSCLGDETAVEAPIPVLDPSSDHGGHAGTVETWAASQLAVLVPLVAVDTWLRWLGEGPDTRRRVACSELDRLGIRDARRIDAEIRALHSDADRVETARVLVELAPGEPRLLKAVVDGFVSTGFGPRYGGLLEKLGHTRRIDTDALEQILELVSPQSATEILARLGPNAPSTPKVAQLRVRAAIEAEDNRALGADHVRKGIEDAMVEAARRYSEASEITENRRLAAAYVLAELGEPAEKVLDRVLAPLLRSEDLLLRAGAAEMALRTAPSSSRARAAMESLLGEPELGAFAARSLIRHRCGAEQAWSVLADRAEFADLHILEADIDEDDACHLGHVARRYFNRTPDMDIHRLVIVLRLMSRGGALRGDCAAVLARWSGFSSEGLVEEGLSAFIRIVLHLADPGWLTHSRWDDRLSGRLTDADLEELIGSALPRRVREIVVAVLGGSESASDPEELVKLLQCDQADGDIQLLARSFLFQLLAADTDLFSPSLSE